MNILDEYKIILQTTDMLEKINIVCGNIEDKRIEQIKELTINFNVEEFGEYKGFLFRKLINKKKEVNMWKKLCEITTSQTETFTDLNKVFTKLTRDELDEGIKRLDI